MIITIWGIIVGFEFYKGLLQLSQWGGKGFTTNFIKMIYQNPVGNFLLLISIITNLSFLIITIKKNVSLNTISILFVLSSLVFLSIFKRLEYDYRLLIIFNLSSTIICVNNFSSHYKAVVFTILVFGSTYSIAYNIIKPALSVLAWNKSCHYEHNKLLFHKIIPRESSVGGSGNLWTFLDDGRFFYSDRYIDTFYKPDYMIYRGFNNGDSLKYVIVEDWKTILSNEYVLINNQFQQDSIQAKSKSLWISKIFNVEDTDFRFRIWKKKSY
jgi:hypothetical protein